MSDAQDNEKQQDTSPDKNPEIAAIVEALDEKKNIWFYGLSLLAVTVALGFILFFLCMLPVPDDASDTRKTIRDAIDFLQSKTDSTSRQQTVKALQTLDHANTAQAIIVGAKILTALTLGIVLIVALSRIITTRYRTIATLYGIAKKK